MKKGKLLRIRMFSGPDRDRDAKSCAGGWRLARNSRIGTVRTFKRSICVDGEVIKAWIVVVREKEAVAA